MNERTVQDSIRVCRFNLSGVFCERAINLFSREANPESSSKTNQPTHGDMSDTDESGGGLHMSPSSNLDAEAAVRAMRLAGQVTGADAAGSDGDEGGLELAPSTNLLDNEAAIQAMQAAVEKLDVSKN